MLTGVGLLLNAFALFRNIRLERAKWAAQLGRDFFGSTYRELRESLDDPDLNRMRILVDEEAAEFTEFLNFFETVAYLRNRKQINDKDVAAIFGYYLDAFRKHPELLAYVQNPLNSYGELATLLESHGK